MLNLGPALTISQLCQSNSVEPGGQILTADMPNWVHFDTLTERILAMSNTTTMVGEMEIYAARRVLKRVLQIVDDRGHRLVYGAEYTSQVRNIPHNDSGHYESDKCCKINQTHVCN